MSSYSGYLVETFVTLAGVCALAVVVLWAARRAGGGRPRGPLELRGYLPLDARRAVYLIQVGEVLFVVGVGDGGFAKIGELPASDIPRDEPARSPAFADVLARMLRPKNAPAPEGGSSPTEGKDPQ